MNQMMLYSKIVTIRDAQIQEKRRGCRHPQKLNCPDLMLKKAMPDGMYSAVLPRRMVQAEKEEEDLRALVGRFTAVTGLADSAGRKKALWFEWYRTRTARSLHENQPSVASLQSPGATPRCHDGDRAPQGFSRICNLMKGRCSVNM